MERFMNYSTMEPGRKEQTVSTLPDLCYLLQQLNFPLENRRDFQRQLDGCFLNSQKKGSLWRLCRAILKEYVFAADFPIRTPRAAFEKFGSILSAFLLPHAPVSRPASMDSSPNALLDIYRQRFGEEHAVEAYRAYHDAHGLFENPESDEVNAFVAGLGRGRACLRR
ncbi:MAG: hypothetical protein WAN36_07895 [Calditrichia bacterium]